MSGQSAENDAPAHGFGDTSDCVCGRNFATVRGLREHITKARAHDARCYQSTGVPDDLPPTLCDCRVLRLIDRGVTPPATGDPTP